MVNGNLTKLPSSWVFAMVRDIADLISGQHILAGDYNYKNDGIPYLTGPADFSFKYPITSKWTTQPKAMAYRNDVLITVKGAGVGKTNILNIDKAAISRQLMAVRGIFLNQHYVYYYLHFMFYIFQEMGAGSTVPGIDRESILNFQMVIPPINEQHRIVAKIEELFSDLDAGVEALKKAKAQLRLYRQAVLKAAFEGRLTTTWREKNKGEIERTSLKRGGSSTISDPTHLHDLPVEWEWLSLKDLAVFKNGINFSKNQKGNGGILTIDVLNMYSKSIYVNLNNCYRVNKQVTSDYALNYGDILLVRSSVKREGVGWATAFKSFSEPVTYCGFIIRARLDTKLIIPEYAIYYLRTSYIREFIINNSSQVTITNVNQNTVGNIPIPLPSIAEQKVIKEEIERYFSLADAVDEALDDGLNQSDRLRQSILKKAFAGELVSQDPEDEPAAELLERIKKEKAGHAAGKKRPGRKAAQRDLNYG